MAADDTVTEGAVPCKTCDGSGVCQHCGGRGYEPEYGPELSCGDCKQTGHCADCDGTGEVRTSA